VNDYVRARYGAPCRGCGYDWSEEDDALRRVLAQSASRFEALLSGRDGSERHPALEWNAVSYIAHTADNTRIWAERVAAAALGATLPVASYDENALGRARGYPLLAVQGCIWSLRRAVGDWWEAEALEAARNVVLDHPELGPLGIREVRRIVAHEAHHHEADLVRILSA